MTAFVIGICGPPGSGKSSLSRALAGLLAGAPVIEYDAYEEITSWPPDRVADWMARGADFDAIPVPGLAADLAALKAGRAVADRVSGGTMRAAAGERPVVVFDTLLGRAHAATAPLIDHLVWLDAPADLALARKLASLLGMPHPEPAAVVAHLTQYLAAYEGLLRPTYAVQAARVRPGADLVFDATRSTDELAATLAQRVASLRAAA